MYSFLVSDDCGENYIELKKAETIDELKPWMDYFDFMYYRWVVEKDGEDVTSLWCKVWKDHTLMACGIIVGENGEISKRTDRQEGTR
jgi:hypothetical protein